MSCTPRPLLHDLRKRTLWRGIIFVWLVKKKDEPGLLAYPYLNTNKMYDAN